MLKGKTALITGASRGIGKAIAIAFAKNHANVIINYYSDKNEALSVLDKAKKYGVKRVVYSASSSAYGSLDVLPATEDFKHTAQALHPYGSTKRMGEMLMRDMGKVTGGPETVCLRYFNVYGPRQSLSNPYTGVAAIFLSRLKNNNPPIIFQDSMHVAQDFPVILNMLDDIEEQNGIKSGSGKGQMKSVGA